MTVRAAQQHGQKKYVRLLERQRGAESIPRT